MFARYATLEALLLLLAGLAVLGGGSLLMHFGPWWTLGFCLAFVLLAYGPLLVRLQDRMLEIYLVTGRFDRALKLAAAIRDSAHKRKVRDLAEFDVGLVHLARGAPADAARSFGRIERHLLQERTRLLVELYQAISHVRAAPAGDRAEPAAKARDVAKEALASFGEDPQLMALEAEALFALGEAEASFDRMRRSLELDPDPRDPSPGERHYHFARAALATGRTDAARKALAIAAELSGDAPFLRLARAELDQLAHAS